MSKVRIAVIGAGWISQEAFLPAVKQTGNAVVTAIVSGNAEKAKQLAEFYDIPDIYDYSSFDVMAASGNVDAVYIATPNSSHCEYALRAARYGLHALVEKPLATTVSDAEKMIAAAKASNICLMTAYRLHNDPATLKVVELIASGIIGDVRFFNSAFSFQSTPDNHRLKAAHWGGPLQDLGVYCLNAARHIFRDHPTKAMAMSSFGNADPRFTEVEEGIAVTLQFSKGRMAQFYAGFGADMLDEFHIAGTKGSISLTNAYRFDVARKLVLQHGDDTQVTEFGKTDNFSGMISYFADRIQHGNRPLADGAEGLADMVGMLAVEAAARSQLPQDIPPMPAFPTYDSKMLRRFPQAHEKLLV